MAFTHLLVFVLLMGGCTGIFAATTTAPSLANSHQEQGQELGLSLGFSDIFGSIGKHRFFDEFYQQHVYLERHGAFANNTLSSLFLLSNAFALCEKQEKGQHSLDGFQIKIMGETQHVTSCAQLEEALRVNGAGVVVRYEDMVLGTPTKEDRRNRGDGDGDDSGNNSNNDNGDSFHHSTTEAEAKAVESLHDLVRSEFGTDSTVHMYSATESKSRALMAHTDPYDVLVLQLQGAKDWTVCLPRLTVGDKHMQTYDELQALLAKENHALCNPNNNNPNSNNSNNSGDDNTVRLFGDLQHGGVAELSPAEIGQLQEIQKRRQSGCTSYEDNDLSSYSCNHFTLSAGDVMYLPKGVIHYAIATEGGSSHITVSLERKGVAWADAIVHAAANTISRDDTTRWPTFMKSILSVIDSDIGVLFLNALPTQLLVSHTSCDLDHDSALAQHTYTQYSTLCHSLLPTLKSTAMASNDIASMLRALEPQDSSDPFGLEAVCSRDAFAIITQALCSNNGALDVDVTSKGFRKQVERIIRSTNTNTHTNENRMRRAAGPGAVCNTGCDEDCNVYTGSCDGGCSTVCNSGCTDCDASCDGQVCNGGCTSGCDDLTCNAGCDSACDTQTCYSACDTCSSCDDGCDGGCDE